MKEFLLFLKDKSILAFLGFVIGFELFLQTGCYKPLLKNQSFASNVNRVTQNVVLKKDLLNPDILVVGTSLAQEGILLKNFNERLFPVNKKIASIAIPGSETLAQNLATEKVLPQLEKVKIVLHIVELERPWADEKWLELVNLPMIAEFDRLDAYKLIKKYNYDLTYEDYSFLFIRSIAYRKDIGDFLLNPLKRIKSIQKLNKKKGENPFIYENEYNESVNAFKLSTIDECLLKTAVENFEKIPEGSSILHKKAVNDTCHLVKSSKVSNVETKTSVLYFQRLKLFYDSLKKRNIKVISIFSPSCELAVFPAREERLALWRNKLSEIGVYKIYELQNILPEKESGKYFYDLFHMNRAGAEFMTEEISKNILKDKKLFEEPNAL